ncbi:7058_t:CDS:1, partial [Cetraspora pellucida]
MDLNSDSEVITGRIKKLNIEQQYQKTGMNYFTEIRIELEKKKVNENILAKSTETEQI